MKTTLLSLFAISLVAGCGGSDKKVEPPAKVDDTNTATPVTGNGEGDMTPAGATAADPQLIAKGAEVFAEHCSTCHGDEGMGGGKTPAVRGAGSLAAFSADGALLAYTKKEMPKDDPGALSEDDYEAVIAWMRR